jgi:hypothetical protein
MQRYKYLLVTIIFFFVFDEQTKLYGQTGEDPFKYEIEHEMNDNTRAFVRIANYIVMAALAIGVLIIVRDIVIDKNVKDGVIAWFVAFVIYIVIRNVVFKKYIG